MGDHRVARFIRHLFTESGFRKHLIGAQHSLNMKRGGALAINHVNSAPCSMSQPGMPGFLNLSEYSS
jgi:hypothetical protein